MKLRTIVKIAITSSVVLLCSGFALYSFFRLSAAEGQKDFDLYELVPSTTSAVFVTDDVLEFVAEVDDLTCSKNQQYLYVSKLFSYLKQSLYALSEDTPHGLSRQMNQMLISFHEPDNERNQVLYCRLGNGDKELVNRFVRKYISSLYPPKTFVYKGEEILIYPMADGDFLACYLTSDFMALSFQKKLIENVIDAYKSDKSLADDPTFTGVRAPKKSVAAATIYARMKGMMGWTEFDMKMKDDFIYFSGITHDADTCFAFINQLRQQQSVIGFPGEALPSTAFYFSRQGITDWASLLSYGNAQEQNGAVRTSEVQNRDKEFSRYLMENAGQDLVVCLFQREDTLQDAAAVLSLSVADVTEAERMLRAFVNTAPADEGRKTPRITFCYTVNKAYLVYRLPQTTLFKQLTSFVEATLDVYAAFYDGRLLLAPDENALSQYIPDDERIITIEDSAELQLLGAKNIVRLETRIANTDGVTPITIRDLFRSALRMRPDRILVGECRGAEARDMLQAMNTGHDGSLSTGHANSPHDIISRFETMVLQGQDFPLNAIRQQIAS